MVYNVLLFVISLLIYFSFGIQPFLFIVVSILSTYIIGKYIKGRKWLLWLSILGNIIVLSYFKFFLIEFNPLKFIVPIGISYYTLQVISYLVDVYKGKYEYENNIFYLGLYLIYIPHLYVGPIARYNDIKEEIVKKKSFDLERIYEGLQRVVLGLIKKLIIALRIQILINSVVSNNMTGIVILLSCLLYSIELYCDFSGGVDIVLGISKVLDFKVMENFDSPYLAENMKEFWNRWHISLSTWLKDYVYIPLGGNRKGKVRQSINVMITFIVSGLWHGLNYLLWGFINGILVILGDKYNFRNKWLNRVINYLVVSILWIFFIYQDNVLSIQMLGKVFNGFKFNILGLGLNIGDFIILGVGVLLLALYDIYEDKVINIVRKLKPDVKLFLLGTSIILVIVFGIYGIGFEVTDFIYSKF